MNDNTTNKKKFHAPGSFALALIFMGWMALVYFTQWMALAQNWYVK